MKWYRSEADEGCQTIRHFFSCINCGSLTSVSTVAAVSADGDPDAEDATLGPFRGDWL
jgi:hypothetical protein